MNENIRVEKTANGVQSITIDRPDRRNALTAAMYQGMAQAVQAADADRDVRVLLISGAGGSFSSGNDVADFQKPRMEFPSPGIQFLQVLAAARKPIVAAVEGHAVGIGTTLLLHCDLVYASETAKFRLPFVNLALCPEGASSYLLPKVAGYKEAARLLMLGEEFDATTAVRAGIATQTTASGQSLAIATQAAQALATKPPGALQTTKMLLRRGDAQVVADTFLVEADQFGRRLTSEEAREAFTAFFEKRAPDFSRFS